MVGRYDVEAKQQKLTVFLWHQVRPTAGACDMVGVVPHPSLHRDSALGGIVWEQQFSLRHHILG